MIFGVLGKKRSGKDTFAATLVEEFGFERRAFADPMKEALLGLDPIVSVGDLDPTPMRLRELVAWDGWEKAKDVEPEVRRLLQNYGQGVRAIEPEFWIKATLRTMDEFSRDYVVTDVRMPNEARALTELGARLIRIERPGLPSDTHETETALDRFEVDETVWNVGSLDDLAKQSRAVAARLGW